ncbi:unnamed protein product [Gulo gulo]|uniref:Uncharacterized protein n=1 Tax=Gulo gulo TaxID=48420 RepID=A0A9X9MDW1_GULGU|nr:unnamed protein product [Gulo gulo]
MGCAWRSQSKPHSCPTALHVPFIWPGTPFLIVPWVRRLPNSSVASSAEPHVNRDASSLSRLDHLVYICH